MMSRDWGRMPGAVDSWRGLRGHVFWAFQPLREHSKPN